ncbi:MAG: VCBS repeat-containing protein [Phycisphaerae bacterium]|nr:VCBS repeat-containing protein [Phycisphaerae bacterium]
MEQARDSYRTRSAPGGVRWFLNVLLLPAAIACVATDRGTPSAWPMHVIDNSSAGADGVRLADANGDRLPDVAAGWEEGGLIRVYLHPGTRAARRPWPAVTVGQVSSPEDAVFADLDGDGVVDVVSCCEGQEKTVFFHWAPRERSRYLDPTAWKTEALPASKGLCQWMFCLPIQVDGRNGVDLVVGGKNEAARIGWFEAPPDAHDLNAWKWHPLFDAGWIMSLIAEDMDGDGDRDILASDRKGASRGCLWIENPGPDRADTSRWPIHRIGAGDREYMFLTVADLDGDGLRDVVAATAGREWVYYRRTVAKPPAWESYTIELPADTGTGKSVSVADVDGDGRQDVVFSCEKSEGKRGLMRMKCAKVLTDRNWLSFDIAGLKGAKFDLVQLVDLDGDGDLDVMTTEEAERLGVIWYENPMVR